MSYNQYSGYGGNPYGGESQAGGYGQANPYEASGGYGAANPYSNEGYGQTVGSLRLSTPSGARLTISL